MNLKCISCVLSNQIFFLYVSMAIKYLSGCVQFQLMINSYNQMYRVLKFFEDFSFLMD